MKNMSTLTTAAIVILFSVSTWAATGSQENDQDETPMMNEGNNCSMMGGGSHEMMTGRGSHGMMMDPHMMHMMMGQHQHHNMSTMEGGRGGKMMYPQMMQQRQQQMSNMEQRLANIEALLEKLVENQKP
ncbi:MAG: hypothetical protein V3R76_00060 [Gammaproteobacteria bacterium]